MNLKVLVARRSKALTQGQLAQTAGISQADISKIEKYGWTPPVALQQKIAAALGVPVESLFDRPADGHAYAHTGSEEQR